MSESVSCSDRTPYVSLIAMIIVITGAGLMCGSNYEALRRTHLLFEDRFYPIQGTFVLQIVGIVSSVLTVLTALINLIAGIMATGETRTKRYPHRRSQSTGQKFARFLTITSYVFVVMWLLLFIAFAVPVTLWIMLHRVCREESVYWNNISADKDETKFTYIFNLTHYGLYRRPLDTSLYTEYVSSPTAFTQLCQEIATVGPLFTICLISSCMTILGLQCFISCLATSSVRLQFSAEIERVRRFPDSQSQSEVAESYPLFPTTASPLNQPHYSPQNAYQSNFNAHPEMGSHILART